MTGQSPITSATYRADRRRRSVFAGDVLRYDPIKRRYADDMSRDDRGISAYVGDASGPSAVKERFRRRRIVILPGKDAIRRRRKVSMTGIGALDSPGKVCLERCLAESAG